MRVERNRGGEWGRQGDRQEKEGNGGGHWSVLPWGPDCPSCLPIKNRIPPQTVCVFSPTPPGCCLPQHKTSVLSFSGVSLLCIVANIPFPVLLETSLLSTCGTCPWQVKRTLHHRSWAAVSTTHPIFLPFPLVLPYPAFPHSPFLS